MEKNYKKDDKFDAIIRQKMTDLEVIPAFDAWDNITTELDKDKTTHKIWWGTGSILLLLLVGTAVFWNKDSFDNPREQQLTSILVNQNIKQTSSNLSQNQKNNFEGLTKEELSQNNSSTLASKDNSSLALNSNLAKIGNQFNHSTAISKNNFNKKITSNSKNISNSKKIILPTNKKEPFSNSIKDTNSLLSEKSDLKENNIIANAELIKAENKGEKTSKIKQIKLTKIGLIKLKNDLQLLDYQSFVTKSKAKEIEIKKATRLTFAFTPLEAYKQLIPNLNDSMIVSTFEDTQTLKTRTSFALTLGMERELNARWEAEWGLNYTRIEQNMNFLYSEKSAPITILFDTNQNGFDTQPVREEKRFVQKYTFNYLGVYGGASYRIFRYDQPEQRVGARFTLATLLNRDKNLNSLQESFTAFYKVNYQLSPYWSFTISPEFNYYFRSTYKKDAFLGAKPYTVGLHLGLVRRFGAKK